MSRSNCSVQHASWIVMSFADVSEDRATSLLFPAAQSAWRLRPIMAV
ncbi:hypothetical protein [Stenotrophomonas maltophilia]|jgi:hypothetical protein|nr:hypothetical protein [Stenotrophomonas maltophilia]MBH1476799.1 hypothetical protein [Stenotrophomonas maltophilia]MBH1502316.1 hypothetical protein [Stenotrophomonas maltophilia]HEL7888385.1 hypothetical protein [Stenotrophomonas maltophilia]